MRELGYFSIVEGTSQFKKQNVYNERRRIFDQTNTMQVFIEYMQFIFLSTGYSGQCSRLLSEHKCEQEVQLLNEFFEEIRIFESEKRSTATSTKLFHHTEIF